MPDAQALDPTDPLRLGAYRVTGRLGSGGQGVVYLGEAEDGSAVAIKLFHARLGADEGWRDAFTRELDAAKRVARFCVAQVLDSGVYGQRPYIVSEYVPGRSLHEVVHAEGPRSGSALDRLAISTATALVALHDAGVVHRDFKPHNVLLAPDGPRVIDFGIARALAGAHTVTSQVVGTPAYMSPEQFAGGGLGLAVDVFSWAGTMAFAATGRPPFGADSMPAIMNRVLNAPPDLDGVEPPLRDLLIECLDKDPSRRPSAQQVLDRLVRRNEHASAASGGPGDDGRGVAAVNGPAEGLDTVAVGGGVSSGVEPSGQGGRGVDGGGVPSGAGPSGQGGGETDPSAGRPSGRGGETTDDGGVPATEPSGRGHGGTGGEGVASEDRPSGRGRRGALAGAAIVLAVAAGAAIVVPNAEAFGFLRAGRSGDSGGPVVAPVHVGTPSGTPVATPTGTAEPEGESGRRPSASSAPQVTSVPVRTARPTPTRTTARPTSRPAGGATRRPTAKPTRTPSPSRTAKPTKSPTPPPVTRSPQLTELGPGHFTDYCKTLGWEWVEYRTTPQPGAYCIRRSGDTMLLSQAQRDAGCQWRYREPKAIHRFKGKSNWCYVFR